jgi:hypothetical protein
VTHEDAPDRQQKMSIWNGIDWIESGTGTVMLWVVALTLLLVYYLIRIDVWAMVLTFIVLFMTIEPNLH